MKKEIINYKNSTILEAKAYQKNPEFITAIQITKNNKVYLKEFCGIHYNEDSLVLDDYVVKDEQNKIYVVQKQWFIENYSCIERKEEKPEQKNENFLIALSKLI
jgi:uncharacterized protein YqfB (UPF0267 family)